MIRELKEVLDGIGGQKISEESLVRKTTSLSQSVKNKINKELQRFNSSTEYERGKRAPYFREIPLDDIFAVLKKHGIIVIQEDFTPWSGFLVGAQGQMYVDLAMDEPDEELGGTTYRNLVRNAKLSLSWYKMGSGNYEIVTYVG